MLQPALSLSPFTRRIRLVRAWQGLALGLATAGVVALAWALADRYGNQILELRVLLFVAAALVLVGAVAGYFWPITAADVARSVDRRANLKNRLGTALTAPDGTWKDEVERDAAQSVRSLRANALYPFRFGRVQIAALATLLLGGLATAAVVTGFGLSQEQVANQEEMAAKSGAVRRVERELVENRPPQTPLNAGEMQLAAQINSLAERMERGKISEPELMREADQIARKAEAEARNRAQQAGEHLDRAAEAMQQAQQERIANAGLKKDQIQDLELDTQQAELLGRLMEAEDFQNPKSTYDEGAKQAAGLQNADDRLLNMSSEQRQALQQRLQQEMSQMQQQLDSNGLSAEQREQIQQQMDELRLDAEQQQQLQEMLNDPSSEAAQQAAQEMLKNENLSEAMRQALEQIANNEGLSEAAQKALEQAMQNGSLNQEMMEQLAQQMQGMTAEQRQQMEQQMQQMQEMMESLASSEQIQQAMEQLMQSEEFQKMAEAMQQAQQAQQQLGEGQEISPEQMQQMQQAMEQAAEAMQNPQQRQAFEQAMEQAMQQMQAGNMDLQAARQMMEAIGRQMQSMGNGNQQQGATPGTINKGEERIPGGETTRTGVSGERRETDENERSIEIKAPAQLNGGGNVPYDKVLPEYKDKADKAVSGQKVPKKHRDRVKEYFDSLQRGK